MLQPARRHKAGTEHLFLKNDAAQATYCKTLQLWRVFFCIIKICVNLERGKKSNTYFRNAHNTKLHFGKHSKKYEASNCKKKDKVKLPISVREEGTNLF